MQADLVTYVCILVVAKSMLQVGAKYPMRPKVLFTVPKDIEIANKLNSIVEAFQCQPCI